MLLGLVVAPTASASGRDGRRSLYAEGLFLSPKDEWAGTTLSVGGVPVEASFGLDGDGVGVGLGVEYRLTRRLGIVAGIAPEAVSRAQVPAD